MLGDNTITSLTDTSAGSKLCANMYSISRDAMLRLHPWNFAIKRVQLAPLADSPVNEYSKLYQLPADCLRLCKIFDITDYRLEGRNILCDSNAIYIRYIAKIEDVARYDTLFVALLAAYLAVKMAYPLTKSNATVESMRGEFKAALQAAKSVDAQEEPGDTFGDFPLISVRG